MAFEACSRLFLLSCYCMLPEVIPAAQAEVGVEAHLAPLTTVFQAGITTLNGISTGRVDFESKVFNGPMMPVVVASVQCLDLQARIPLGVQISQLSLSGFHYEVFSLNLKQSFDDAKMHWMAYGCSPIRQVFQQNQKSAGGPNFVLDGPITHGAVLLRQETWQEHEGHSAHLLDNEK